MPIREPLINNEIYHVVTRGVGNSLIFNNRSDYFRAIFSLYKFNTSKPVAIREERKFQFHHNRIDRVPFYVMSKGEDLLVEILTFCFMPNHIHLLLKQIRKEGITKFMRKFGVGYAGYFNRKYERRGHLFQGRFKSVHVKTDNQLKTVFVYIHANPISLIEPGWKENGIKNPEGAIEFLESYKWSSYLDYIGKENFPLISKRNFILKLMGSGDLCKEFVYNWIKYKGDLSECADLILE